MYIMCELLCASLYIDLCLGVVVKCEVGSYCTVHCTAVAASSHDQWYRLSIRALHYMKREIEYLLKRCRKPKVYNNIASSIIEINN